MVWYLELIASGSAHERFVIQSEQINRSALANGSLSENERKSVASDLSVDVCRRPNSEKEICLGLAPAKPA